MSSVGQESQAPRPGVLSMGRRALSTERRARSARAEHLTALAVLGAVSLFYLWPVLLGGKVLLPNSILFYVSPWSAAAPANFAHGLNGLLADIPDAYYPWNVLARHMIDGGHLPLWNPYAYSGTPFYANPQTALLSPFSLPMWIFSLPYGLALAAWAKLWIGGFGAYRLARRLRLSLWPGLLVGLSFMLCAFMVLWLEYETLPAVAAMLPWALLLCERIATEGRLRDLVGLSGVTLVVILAGQPEIAVHVLYGAGIYLVIRVFAVPAPVAVRGRRLAPGLGGERGRRLALGLGGIVLGVLLSMVVLLPVLKAGLGTPGAKIRTGGGAVPLPWSAARTALFPGWWSRSGHNAGPVDYLERTYYVGVVVVLLAVVAALSRGEWRRKLALVVLAVLGIALSFRLPGLFWLGTHTPGLDNTVFARLLLWPQVAVPLLAGFGLQRLIEAPRRQRVAWATVTGALAVAALAVIVIGPSWADVRTALNHFRTGTDFGIRKVIALVSVVWWILFVALFAIVLALMRTFGGARLAAAALTVIVVLDLLHFSSGFNPMLAPAIANPPSTPAIAYLQSHAGRGRVLGAGFTLVNDYDSIYGLRDVRGYDPPQPSQRYLNLWRTANPAQIASYTFVVPKFQPSTLRLMNLLGASYFVTPPGADPANYTPLRRVYSGSDATVFAAPQAAPRALVARRVVVTDGEGQTLAAITPPTFDPRSTAVLESASPGLRSLARGRDAAGTVTVTSSADEKVSLRAQLSRASLVVLNDAYAPGWSVTVDGRVRPALRVNDVMRGVIAPAGSHRITWSYGVPGLGAGLIITIASALGLLVTAIAIGQRGRRRLNDPDFP